MSVIVPYREEELRDSVGAFVKPDGEFIFLKKGGPMHLDYASDYCLGPQYDSLILRAHQEKDKKIDPFASSKLSKKDLEVYKSIRFSDVGMDDLDFLIQYLGIDVIRRGNILGGMLIITASPQPCVKYFNYEIMDTMFEFRHRIIGVNHDRDHLINYVPTDQENEENERYRAKIKRIKDDVNYKDRHLFFE